MNGSYEKRGTKKRNKKEEKEEKHNIQKYTGTLPEHNTRISYATVTGGASCGKQANQYDIKYVS